MRGDIVDGRVILVESLIIDGGNGPDYTIVISRPSEGPDDNPGGEWERELKGLKKWDYDDEVFSTHRRVYEAERSYLVDGHHDLTYWLAIHEAKRRFDGNPRQLSPVPESVIQAFLEGTESSSQTVPSTTKKSEEYLETDSGFMWYMFVGTSVGIIVAVLITISDGFDFAGALGVILLGCLIGSLFEWRIGKL